MLNRHILSLLSAAIAIGIIGCLGCSAPEDANAQSVRRPSNSPTPEVGSAVTVHFVRSALGVADKQPIPIRSGNHNGADLTLAGKFVRMDDHWIVLLATGQSTEQWIARQNILYMTTAAP